LAMGKIGKSEQAWEEIKVTLIECPHCGHWDNDTRFAFVKTVELKKCARCPTIFTDKCPLCGNSGTKETELTLFKCPKCKEEISRFGKEWIPL